MRAVKCDACGRLVEVTEAVTLSISAITSAQTVQSWAGVEVCGACLTLPAVILLARACDGFKAPTVADPGSAVPLIPSPT